MFFNVIEHANAAKNRLITRTWYKFYFSKIGSRTVLKQPARIEKPKNIYLGSNVVIDTNSWLVGINDDSKIIVEDNTTIGRFFHCVSLNEVLINKDVLIAERVFISDCNHEYQDITVPVMNQGLYSTKKVSVGQGTWIGEGACVLGVSIGQNSIIAANAVVTKDVGDYCVVAGIPARVLKKYNFDKRKWEQIHEQ